MHEVLQGRSGGLNSRYEYKYVVSPVVVPAIREYLRPFQDPDPYTERDGGYSVCSLYVDSAGLGLYRNTVAGLRDRYKLRLRTYSDDPGGVVFLEVKRKLQSVVHKSRARVTRDLATRLVESRWRLPIEPAVCGTNGELDVFLSHATLVSARPVLRVRYFREAFESHTGEPVRVTLDHELTHAVTPDGDLRHGAGEWTPTPVGGVILEIKFTERFPSWVQDLVRTFALRARSVPKYVLCVDRAMGGRPPSATLGGSFSSAEEM